MVNRRFVALMDAIKIVVNGADIDIDAFFAKNGTCPRRPTRSAATKRLRVVAIVDVQKKES